ncbi:ATP-grasp domain-containing protein [bacterium]|nr:ATP-grasp domain-containing protein [bacterium]MBU3929672.1 ATP-grasp domain-containing protein [bacterium]MBU4122629.1 ATP-grasp domain-containing protein [bacterium]
MKKKIAVIHNQIKNNTPDELDVLAQRDLIRSSCLKIGYDVNCLTVEDDLQKSLEKITSAKPDIVFNLVEAIWGKSELIYFAPALLNLLKIPYTGTPLEALFITTNKVLSKKIMQMNGLPTAGYFSINALSGLNPHKTYIAKPIWEEASVGISNDYIFTISETAKLDKISKLSPTHYFVEEFINGREFNVSVLANGGKAEVLPPAEMIFSSFFDDKHKIIGYEAKWDENSEEYKNTNRVFGTADKDILLKDKLIDICGRCWKVFSLKGYARIDFRVDEDNNVYILEINGNPCIAENSGFVAAVKQAGYSVETMVERILSDLN